MNLAIEAGNRILEVYATDFEVQSKDDQSPVTQADFASHDIIAAGLQALTPDIPILSEEDGLPPFEVRCRWPRYWLIDPLDGTREFVNRNGEFTVNVALIEDHAPVLGVVHVPVRSRTYIGCGREITAKDGAVIQGNYDTYPVVRMSESPHSIHVHIMESTAAPGGVGEPGVPPVAPAIVNAYYAATGNRIRELPLRKAGLT